MGVESQGHLFNLHLSMHNGIIFRPWFRDQAPGRRLLVATTAAEEGMDVPCCEFVVSPLSDSQLLSPWQLIFLSLFFLRCASARPLPASKGCRREAGAESWGLSTFACSSRCAYLKVSFSRCQAAAMLPRT